MHPSLLDELMAPSRRGRREQERSDDLAALAALEQKRALYLERLREAMGELYERRERMAPGHGYVTADDARDLLESWHDVPPPELMSRNFMGVLFRSGGWESMGRVPSATKGSHGRSIVAWRKRKT